MGETLAVFGGSFDPPHLAHTLAAAHALAVPGIDRVLVIPTFQHPFDKPLSAYEHRVRMCEIAMGALAGVDVSRLEERLEGPSLTLRTLEELARENPQNRLRLVIGSDLLAETPDWHEFERVRELAPPLIVPRAGYPTEGDGPGLPNLSSTEARRRLRDHTDTTDLLDPRVAAYALEHHLY